MNDRLKERALRVLASALLNSTLTSQELRQLSDELSYGSLGSDLGRLLREALDRGYLTFSNQVGERKKGLLRTDDAARKYALLWLLSNNAASSLTAPYYTTGDDNSFEKHPRGPIILIGCQRFLRSDL